MRWSFAQDSPNAPERWTNCWPPVTWCISIAQRVPAAPPTVAIGHLYRCPAWKLDEASAYVTGRRQCSPNLEAILAANWGHANEETARHCISRKPS
jgi:hypothetical protein